eukprot:8616243-Pyramimonas_sp.AAC.1
MCIRDRRNTKDEQLCGVLLAPLRSHRWVAGRRASVRRWPRELFDPGLDGLDLALDRGVHWRVRGGGRGR